MPNLFHKVSINTHSPVTVNSHVHKRDASACWLL